MKRRLLALEPKELGDVTFALVRPKPPLEPWTERALARGGRCDDARGVYTAAFEMASEVDSDPLRNATDAARAEAPGRCAELE